MAICWVPEQTSLLCALYAIKGNIRLRAVHLRRQAGVLTSHPAQIPSPCSLTLMILLLPKLTLTMDKRSWSTIPLHKMQAYMT